MPAQPTFTTADIVAVLKSAVSLIASLSLCTTAAALENSRTDVQAFVDEMHREHGFDRAELQRVFDTVEIRQPILDAISRPAERVVPWHEYRERFVIERRIAEGRQFWSEQSERLARITDPNLAATIVGILGVETSFGRITGRYRVLDALATLAFHYPPRSAFFRKELKEFLILSREEAIDPLTALGSYAGAMGAPQFISSSYRHFAVDGDGDGQRNLWSSWDDVIDSVANYLRVHGWQDGEPILAEAELDGDLSRFEDGLTLNETVRSLREKGVRFTTNASADAPAMLIVATGKDGPVYRVGFKNFYAITRYNRSAMYAMAVHELGVAIQQSMQNRSK